MPGSDQAQPNHETVLAGASPQFGLESLSVLLASDSVAVSKGE